MTRPPKPRDGQPPRDFLAECLRYWSASLALHRAIEMRMLWRYPLKRPILDLGCGDGRFAKIFFGEPIESGIDVDPAEVGRARSLSVYRQALVGDAAKMPFPDKSFSSVFSNCVLEHVNEFDATLAEIRRILEPGGVLLATVPTPRWESDGPIPWLRRVRGGDWISDRMNDILRKLWHHRNLHEPDEWNERLRRAGMQMQVWEPCMVPEAYATFARWLPTASLSFVQKKLVGGSILSSGVREMFIPYLSGRLRSAYLADSTYGTNGLLLAVRTK